MDNITIERCAERVSRGAWSRTSQCRRNKGFGKDRLYCKQHGARHPAENAEPIATWYCVRDSEYSVRIEAVGVLEESEKSLTLKGGRVAKISQFERYVPTKEAALEFYQQKIAGLRARAEKMEQELARYR